MNRPKTKRKGRPAVSCTECYSKKQKCDHRYPCNHCTQRRKPECCTYQHSATRRPTLASPTPAASAPSPLSPLSLPGDVLHRPVPSPASPTTALVPGAPTHDSDLASCLGYATGSSCNLLGIMKQYHLVEPDHVRCRNCHQVPASVLAQMRECFDRLPSQQVLNALIQHFFHEVNWIFGMTHSTTFLAQYQELWKTMPPSEPAWIDFAILVLEISAYSAQFLPCATYTADTIHGIPIQDIRKRCHQLALDLATLQGSAGGLNSFAGVQYYSYRANYEMNEGRIQNAWYLIGQAIRIDLALGFHTQFRGSDTASATALPDDLAIEMSRRTHWNLYIWDRHWAAVLDRQPHLKDAHCTVLYPQMRLNVSSSHPEAPDPFQERTLQAKLAEIWHSLLLEAKSDSAAYDPVLVEEQQERLEIEFISQLPPCFCLQNPESRWDTEVPRLPAQRELLHMSILALQCLMYRPLLTVTPDCLKKLPVFKQQLFTQHRHALVETAIAILDSTARLHSNLNANQTRFFLVSFYTFEPTMVLALYLHSCRTFRDEYFAAQANLPTSPTSGMQVDYWNRSLASIIQAMKRLENLKEVSPIANIAFDKLQQVMAIVKPPESRGSKQDTRTSPENSYDELLNRSWNHHNLSSCSDDIYPPKIGSIGASNQPKDPHSQSLTEVSGSRIAFPTGPDPKFLEFSCVGQFNPRTDSIGHLTPISTSSAQKLISESIIIASRTESSDLDVGEMSPQSVHHLTESEIDMFTSTDPWPWASDV